MKIRLSDATKDLQKAAVVKCGYNILRTGTAEKVGNGWLIFDDGDYATFIVDAQQDQVSQVSDTTLKQYLKVKGS